MFADLQGGRLGGMLSRVACLAVVLLLAGPTPATAQCNGCARSSFAGSGRAYAGPHPFSNQLSAIATEDFNRDGHADVAVTRDNVQGAVLVYLGNGSGELAAPVSSPVISYPRTMTARDFNGDGYPDLVLTDNGVLDGVHVYLGIPGGRFSPGTAFPAGSDPYDVAVADFNRDGRDDLAVLNRESHDVSLLLGSGTGSFVSGATIPIPQFGSSIAAGDFNGDLSPDLAVTSQSAVAVVRFLGDGTGGFGPGTSFPVPANPLQIAVGHFNPDGHPDLVVSGGGFFDPPGTWVLLGNGIGGFGMASIVAPLVSFIPVAVADFNADGKDDVGLDAITTVLGRGDGTFDPPRSYFGGYLPRGFALADFNQDARLDAAVANQTFAAENLLLLLGDGTGGFEKPLELAAAGEPRHVAAGQLNGDGRPDLAVANYGSSEVSVFLSTPGGGFAPALHLPTQFPPTGIAIADFNGDGQGDVVVSKISSAVTVFLGTGAGSLGAGTDYDTGLPCSGMAVADFNGDARPDVVVTTNQGVEDSGSVLLGTGTGGFEPPKIFQAGPNAEDVAVADFDSDGKMDIALARGVVTVLPGTGLGTFAGGTDLPFSVSAYAVTVGDFNVDGRPDLAVASWAENKAAVRLNGGPGGFAPPTIVDVGYRPYGISVGDFNRDAKPDLALPNDESGLLAILRGNGTGGFLTAEHFVSGGGSFGVTVADLNADGADDVAVANRYARSISVFSNTNCMPKRLGSLTGVSRCNVPGSPFHRQPLLHVLDDGGNRVPCASGSVQVSLVPGTGTPGALVAGTSTVPLVSGSAAFFDLSVDQPGTGYELAFTTGSLVPTRSVRFRVDPTCVGPWSFHTADPCRVVDTRTLPGPWGGPALAANAAREFSVVGRCGIPPSARAVAINLTAVGATHAGHLTAYPSDFTTPATSTLNFRPIVARANTAILRLSDTGALTIHCGMVPGPGHSVDVLVDVTGYFQ